MTYDKIRTPDPTIDDIIAKYGALRVLLQAAIALVHVPELRPPPEQADHLNEHLRRDVGLPPLLSAQATAWSYFRG